MEEEDFRDENLGLAFRFKEESRKLVTFSSVTLFWHGVLGSPSLSGSPLWLEWIEWVQGQSRER